MIKLITVLPALQFLCVCMEKFDSFESSQSLYLQRRFNLRLIGGGSEINRKVCISPRCLHVVLALQIMRKNNFVHVNIGMDVHSGKYKL